MIAEGLVRPFGIRVTTVRVVVRGVATAPSPLGDTALTVGLVGTTLVVVPHAGDDHGALTERKQQRKRVLLIHSYAPLLRKSKAKMPSMRKNYANGRKVIPSSGSCSKKM